MTSNLEVSLIPILEDNYAYLVREKDSDKCIVVDPGEAEPVLKYLEEHSYTLTQIWITHHHSDHIGGVEELVEKTQCEVLGPKDEIEGIPKITQPLSDLDIFQFGSHKVKIFSVPGHTLGHIAYWFYQDGLLFSGDTLFSLGCGFLFEGTPKQMWASLRRLRDLPGETLVYCGHEYTQKNAEFALSIDPDNQDLIAYSKEVDEKRAQNKPTLPCVLRREVLTNPFLRADLPYWKKLLELEDATPDEIFAVIREKKNNFK